MKTRYGNKAHGKRKNYLIDWIREMLLLLKIGGIINRN